VSHRKGKPQAHGGGGVHAPAWMISWADMTTLLWACFVLLWSFSTLDLAKFQAAMSSLQGALGVLQGGAMVLNQGDIPMHGLTGNKSAGREDMEKIQKKVKGKAQESGFGGSVETAIGPRGLTIRFSDTALFDAGSNDIRPEALPVLDVISQEIGKISNPVQVEGHSDPTPIHTAQFPSNWELSTGRATAIVHYLVEFGGVSPERLSAAGYSFYHPVAPNDSPENRARNRRVDVIVLNGTDKEAEEQRQDALSYLEGPDSSGIVMGPDESGDDGSGSLSDNTSGSESDHG
jgi:chemotaxis protein MotB